MIIAKVARQVSILRYGNEVREAEPYFERLTAKKPDTESVALEN
jgi:non-homologous end joining protein Ku